MSAIVFWTPTTEILTSVKPTVSSRIPDRVDPVVGDGDLENPRRIGGAKPGGDIGDQSVERVVVNRIPDIEQITAAGGEHPIGFLVGLFLIGKEHDSEPTDDRVVTAILERQRGRVGNLTGHPLFGTELTACHIEHGRVEVSHDKMGCGRQ